MSEDTASENSVVVSDSEVSISKERYQMMVKTMSSQNQKIQAFKNLHQLIQSKDNELKSTREKAENLQAALDRAELRLVNQIRLAAASKSPCVSTLEADSVACENAGGKNEQVVPKKFQPSSDIEMDGACLIEQSSHFRGEVPQNLSKPLSPQFSSVKSGNFVRSSSPLSTSESTPLDRCSTLQSLTPKMSVPSIRSAKNTDSLMSLDASEKVSLSGNTTLKSFGGAGGFSKDLLDKLMHQNARLRKVIKDILEQRGTTIESHLEKQETQAVVDQLREELRLSKTQNERLKQIINMKEEDDVVKKYAEQSESFQKLKKTVAMLQAMVDAYGKEYEKLQEENKTLKEQISTTFTTKQKTLSGKSDESYTSVAVDPATRCDSLKLQHDEIVTKFRMSESECSELKKQCQELQGVVVKYNKEILKVEALNRRCAELESEKQLLESQNVVYQEDFAAERKEGLAKQQQFETALAKHQDWIRRLVAEAQKSRSSLEEEKAMRMKAEVSFRDIEARFRQFIVDSRSSTSCRTSDVFSLVSTSGQYSRDLQVDHAAESSAPQSDLSQNLSYSAQDDGKDDSPEPLVCPRCEREFEYKDKKKWQEHTERCTDD